MYLKVITIFLIFASTLFAQKFYYNYGKKIYVNVQDSINSRSYTNENNQEVQISNKIILKIKEHANIEEITQEYNVSLLEEIYTNTYIVATDSKDDVFDKANELYNNKNIIFSQPSFTRKVTTR